MNETEKKIAKGVSNHLWQSMSMGAEINEIQASQIAVQILVSLVPEAFEKTGDEVRTFLRECGFSDDIVDDIYDTQPLAVY
jgi:hypothetical protein